MFTETLTQHDDVVGIACEGKLSEDDPKRMHALLHARLEAAAMPGLVIDLSAFQDYEGLSALSEDLKMDTKHRNDFRRIAVIGDRKWIEWGTTLADLLTRAEMRWFDSQEREDAADWARSS